MSAVIAPVHPQPVSTGPENYHYGKNSPRASSANSSDDEFSSSGNEDESVDDLPVIPGLQIKKVFIGGNKPSTEVAEPIEPIPDTTLQKPSRRVEFMQSSTPMVNYQKLQKKAAGEIREGANVNRNLAQTLKKYTEERIEGVEDGQHDVSEEEERRANVFKDLKRNERELKSSQEEVERLREEVEKLRKRRAEAEAEKVEMEKEIEELKMKSKALGAAKDTELDQLQEQLREIRKKYDSLLGNEAEKLGGFDFGRRFEELRLVEVEETTWIQATNDLKNILNKFGVPYNELKSYVKFLSEDEFRFISAMHRELHGLPLERRTTDREVMNGCFRLMLEEVRELKRS
ncbi:DEKNAAC103509 [Brettanomyces naardenensis]|uniref:DEKNAAC103509 n=1 Tax=Brettanomyces naardenensis TaxID=13370 RepID=A0A448YNG1_BRENA|nr:DEKNAAC103509 [Brettanomyces naardenensis]